MKILLATLCLSAFAVSGRAEMSARSLREAAAYSSGLRGLSMLVAQHGKIIFEDYENGNSATTQRRIYSGTKSFWAVAAIAAEADGILRLDERVAQTIPEWRSDPRKSLITIRELLNMTSGLAPADALNDNVAFANMNATAVSEPLVRAPGTTFIYEPSGMQVFCEVLRRKLAVGGETPFHYLQRRILRPLGIAPFYLKDRAGNPVMATGFRLTAREWARFGEMILRGGNFNGRQIVPANLLRECFVGTSANPAFGLGFWLNRDASRAREFDIENALEPKWWRQNWRGGVAISKDAPRDLVVSLGSGYQRLFIIPSLDLVIVRQGFDAKFSDALFLRKIFGR